MKLLLLVFAVCAVGSGTIQSSKLLDFSYYWRDWDVNSTIPDDAVAGGVDADGHPTYVARSVSNRYGIIVSGTASPQAKRMWFEYGGMEHAKTKDIEILCVLNQIRLKWVVAKYGDTVDKVAGDNVLIFGGSDRDIDTTIGRQKIGNEILVGKVAMMNNGTFWCLCLCQSGRGRCVDKFEVLLYVTDVYGDT